MKCAARRWRTPVGNMQNSWQLVKKSRRAAQPSPARRGWSSSRKIADAWDPAKDEAAGEQCKAYGAAAFMRIPGRLHITWQDDTTLRVELDAGTQTRLFSFANAPTLSGERTWQGHSFAQWERPAAARGGGPPPAGGSLRVVTTNLRAGYLRRNGVPYSENATVTEHLDVGNIYS